MHVDEEEKLNDKTSSSLEPRGGWLNNERLPAPDLPSGALESWAYCVVFSFSLPLPASCLRNDQSNKKVKSTRISRAGSYLKPLLG